MGQSRKIFEGGTDKVVRSLDHLFNVESLEAQRRTAELSQRWQSGNSIALTRGLLGKVVERLPTHTGRFIDLHHVTQAPVIVSQDTICCLLHGLCGEGGLQ